MGKSVELALVAIDSCGVPVTKKNHDQRIMFIARDTDKIINIVPYYVEQVECWKMITSTGEYLLDKHSDGYWFNTCKGIPVKVFIGQRTGQLEYTIKSK